MSAEESDQTQPSKLTKPSKPSKQGQPGYVHPLAYVRATRGWSQAGLAQQLRQAARERRVNLATGKNRIWRWENYGTIPDEETQLLLAEILEVPAELVATLSWPQWLPAWNDVRVLFPWSQQGSLQALAAATGAASSDARGFVGLTGVPLLAVAQEWQLMEPAALQAALAGRRVPSELVHGVAQRTRRLRRLEDILGGGEIRRLVAEELGLVTTLLHRSSYSEEVGRRLLTVAAELAQFAGWASFDAGAQGAAQRLYITALHAAHTAGDRALGAYVLACMSYQLAHVGCPNDAVRLVCCARQGANGAMPRRVTALLQLRLAYAHAAAGDRRACAQALGSAADAASGAEHEHSDEPPWLYWLNRAHLDALEARCLATLGHRPRAIAQLERAIETELPSFPRDGVIHLVWLAEAHLSANEAEAASAAITRAQELAHQVSSARSLALVRAFQRRLGPYPRAGRQRGWSLSG